MNASCYALVLAVLLLGTGGCRSGTNRKDLLPPPPEGWKWQEEASEETIADAGVRVGGSYVPAPDNEGSKGIDKVRITVAWLKEGAAKEGERKLRRLPEGSQFMEAIEVAGHKAMASAPIYKEQLVSITVAPGCKVDIVLFAREKPTAPGDAERIRKVVQLFAEKIDYAKLKEKK